MTTSTLVAILREALGARSESRESVPSVFAEQGLDTRQYAQLQMSVKNVKFSPPERWTGDEDNKGRDVSFFLQELKSYFEISWLPPTVWALFARNFMGHKAKKQWEREVEHLREQSGTAVLVWKDFDTFIRQSCAQMLPARAPRQAYKKLRQTGSVKQFVRDQRQLVRELDGTPFHPGGSVFDDFIDHLKPDVQLFVQNNAPTGWWTDIEHLYQKAMDFEMNGLASGKSMARGPDLHAQRAEVPKAGEYVRHTEKVTGIAGKKRPRENNHEGRHSKRGSDGDAVVKPRGVFIPKAEMDARFKAGVCQFCGKGSHKRADCSNPKSLTPALAEQGQGGSH